MNAAANVHSVHGEFSAPPYGQPHVAPDNPPGASSPQPPDPEQMQPDMAMAHHMAELAKKHADIRATQASTALTAAKIPQVAHQTMNTAVTTNRLLRTPIPQPGQGNSP